MYKQSFFFTLLLGLLFCACSEPAKDPLLIEAHHIHLKAMDIEKAISEDLKSIDSDTSSIVSIKKRLSNWRENLVEVPGFEEEHDHSHDHAGHDHHDHGPTLDVSPADMLTIQKEFFDTIQVIQKDLVQVKATLQ